ncbi:MAG: NUDIX hydrolase [uncultured bacterium]|nr:MAG: NUDIX hydrolase [uncultured bacterium]HBY73396.1 diadenosine tetraphosphate hydrolase [Candidatus Kerfeldbacteria bacterium]
MHQPTSKPTSRKPLRRTKQKSVGAVILNADNHVLIMYSAKNRYWEFPKGKVEPGEKELDTLKREMFEETGIQRFRLHPQFREFLYYRFRVHDLLIQKVVVYYLFKTGAEVKLSDEHKAYKWVEIEKVPQYLKHVNQRDLMKRVKLFLAKHPL